VAAPGLLSEVAVNTGVQAARVALEARRRRFFAVGWPSIDLSPDRRLAVLAAALPAAALDSVELPRDGEGRWEIEPVDETGPGYRLGIRAGILRGAAVTPRPGGKRLTTLAWVRRPGPASGLLNRINATLRPARLTAAASRSTLGRPRRR